MQSQGQATYGHLNPPHLPCAGHIPEALFLRQASCKLCTDKTTAICEAVATSFNVWDEINGELLLQLGRCYSWWHKAGKHILVHVPWVLKALPGIYHPLIKVVTPPPCQHSLSVEGRQWRISLDCQRMNLAQEMFLLQRHSYTHRVCRVQRYIMQTSAAASCFLALCLTDFLLNPSNQKRQVSSTCMLQYSWNVMITCSICALD